MSKKVSSEGIKEGIIKIIDGEPYYHYKYTDYLYQEIKKVNKEIERLKNGYCELKVRCNNGECDCTNEEYDGMVESNIKLSLEVERLNNIIDELEEYILNHYIVGHTIQNASLDDIINKLKELKNK